MPTTTQERVDFLRHSIKERRKLCAECAAQAMEHAPGSERQCELNRLATLNAITAQAYEQALAILFP